MNTHTDTKTFGSTQETHHQIRTHLWSLLLIQFWILNGKTKHKRERYMPGLVECLSFRLQSPHDDDDDDDISKMKSVFERYTYTNTHTHIVLSRMKHLLWLFLSILAQHQGTTRKLYLNLFSFIHFIIFLTYVPFSLFENFFIYCCCWHWQTQMHIP